MHHKPSWHTTFVSETAYNTQPILSGKIFTLNNMHHALQMAKYILIYMQSILQGKKYIHVNVLPVLSGEKITENKPVQEAGRYSF